MYGTFGKVEALEINSGQKTSARNQSLFPISLKLLVAVCTPFLLYSNPANAETGFSGLFAPSNWTLTNQNANGFVNSSLAPASISITGGDNQSFQPGSTQFKINTPISGSYSFKWIYTTKDVGSVYDPFYFIKNNQSIQLTSDNGGLSQVGTYTFNADTSDQFGYEIKTVDNIVGASTVYIVDFSNPLKVQKPNNQLQIAGVFDRSFSALATATSDNANSTGDPIGSTGFTTGQAAAAGITPDFLSDLYQFFTIPTETQLTAALNSLTPEPYAAMQSVGLDTLKRQRQQILVQAGHCKERGWILNAETDKKESNSAHPLCAFAMTGNANAQINGSNGLAFYNSAIFTSFLGLEYQPSQEWTVGGTFGYGNSNLSNYSLSPASISSNNYSGMLYGLYKPAGPWNMSGLLGYTRFNYSGQRNITLNTISSQAASNYSANGLTAALNATYDISIGSVDETHPILLKPLIGVAWAAHQQNSFTETGAGSLNLSVDPHSSQSLISTVGMTLEAPIPLSETTTVVPRLSVDYQHDFLASDTSNQSVSASFPTVPAAGSFSSQGENQGPDTLNLAADVELRLASSTALYANTNYELFTHGNQISYGGGLRIKF
jgi:uncharacterized protein YhjY with autotransporter beta-barrel domain